MTVMEATSGAQSRGIGWLRRSIVPGGFFDRHPILVPATAFFVCWIPYLIVFFRRTIAFGDLGAPYPLDAPGYWILFIIQLGVCVISHSLTIRTIVRLYAPLWLIWGSIAFYALSPAWGLMTAADIRHPLFAAVFCVFTSSCVFAVYSKRPPRWLWVQLAGGALAVSLLRAEGIFIILPTLVAVFVYRLWRWAALDTDVPTLTRFAAHFKRLSVMQGSDQKKEEARWSDACAAFLVLSAVGLLFLLMFCVGWGLPLGEPSYGSVAASAVAPAAPDVAFPSANLTGTDDVGGIIPFAVIADNSVFSELATSAARLIFSFQCLPVENLAFSWVFFVALFAVFLLFALSIAAGWRARGKAHDFRPLIIGLAMVIIIACLFATPADATLRYLMPVLAAQPMFFGACFVDVLGLPARGLSASRASTDSRSTMRLEPSFQEASWPFSHICVTRAGLTPRILAASAAVTASTRDSSKSTATAMTMPPCSGLCPNSASAVTTPSIASCFTVSNNQSAAMHTASSRSSPAVPPSRPKGRAQTMPPSSKNSNSLMTIIESPTFVLLF